MDEQIRKTGIDVVDQVPWGTHLCLFYQTEADLMGTLAPYFRAGLESNEFCMWIAFNGSHLERARRSLRSAIENLDLYVEKGQMEILAPTDWYTRSGAFEPDRVMRGWLEKEDRALRRGFEGLRVAVRKRFELSSRSDDCPGG